MSRITFSKEESRLASAILEGDASDPVLLLRNAGADTSFFFEHGDWRKVDFRKSNLDGVSFYKADLREAHLTEEQLAQVAKTRPKHMPEYYHPQSASETKIKESTTLLPPKLTKPSQSGLSEKTIREVLIKTIYKNGAASLSEIAEMVSLPKQITEELVTSARSQGLLEETPRQSNDGSVEYSYRVTEQGKHLSREALEESSYYGPMPVPLDTYIRQIEEQSIRREAFSRERFDQAMNDPLISEDLKMRVGPAVLSGESLLLYGPPGCGKLNVALAASESFDGHIFIPYAIEVGGEVITVYDSTLHVAVEESGPVEERLHDQRFVRCKRPIITVGGELTMSMFELGYQENSHVNSASLQLLACGGTLIINDLGRQAEPPQSIINKLQTSLGRRRDNYALKSGRQVVIPFDCFAVFTTNFHPNELFDRAALEAVLFKVLVDGPEQKKFLEVIAQVAREYNCPLDEETLVYLLNELYPKSNLEYRFSHVDSIFRQLYAFCTFDGIPMQMNKSLLTRAWESIFVKEDDQHK